MQTQQKTVRAHLKYNNLNVPLQFNTPYEQVNILEIQSEIFTRKFIKINETVSRLQKTFPNWWYLVGIPAFILALVFTIYPIFSYAVAFFGMIEETHYYTVILLEKIRLFLFILMVFGSILVIVLGAIYQQLQVIANKSFAFEMTSLLVDFTNETASTGIYWKLDNFQNVSNYCCLNSGRREFVFLFLT